ncbi:MAG: helix-turn-helix domain-containing protein [Peptococcaceae bacterium]
MDSIGQRIHYARKLRKLSLTDVKERTGLSTGNLSELENDKFAPSANALLALRKVFNVSADWLLTGDSPMTLLNNAEVKEEAAVYLSDEERKLLEAYRTLNEQNKRDIQGYIHVITSQTAPKTK